MSAGGGFRWQRALAIGKKEVFHILRDPFMLAFALGLPVLLVVFFGVAIDFNVKDIQLAVYDGDSSQSSRQLEDVFTSSRYFHLRFMRSPYEVMRLVDANEAKGALIVERDFEKDLNAGRGGRLQLLLDGSDNSTVGIILGYLRGIQLASIPRLTGAPVPLSVDLRTRFLFNPELNSRWFVVPGLVVVVLAVLSVLLTAVTVAREWENGSMELLLSTPVRPSEIIVGKLAPYAVLGLGAVMLVYVVARTGFGVPFVGSYAVFILGAVLFLSAYLAQGVLISVISRKQQLAMQLGIVSGLLPSLLLSGFIFPIESMPLFFQYFTSILPAKWFMMISRSAFLEGGGFSELLKPLAALVVFNVLLIFLAVKRFKRDMEP